MNALVTLTMSMLFFWITPVLGSEPVDGKIFVRLGIGYELSDTEATLREKLSFDDASIKEGMSQEAPASCYAAPGITEIYDIEISKKRPPLHVTQQLFELGAMLVTIHCGGDSFRRFPTIEASRDGKNWYKLGNPSAQAVSRFSIGFIHQLVSKVGWTVDEKNNTGVLQVRRNGEVLFAFAAMKKRFYAAYYFRSESNRKKFNMTVKERGLEYHNQMGTFDNGDTRYTSVVNVGRFEPTTFPFTLSLAYAETHARLLDYLYIALDAKGNAAIEDQYEKITDILSERLNTK
ncbi:hypothetical protein Q669_00470 [Labrenzia sp. C1B10]|uniref:hypothetical protein n=1 Tax=unclassified Labrenzia TaxID=2648686 RepID=UPI0003B8EF20|nr:MULTISPECIES: hypothetical protein [unclassified Labrenzia]ERP98764.1 hypothetical protein Q669_00470 [Labrenzia sp. C1B10]ERS00966.1 hypothetical protein Q675_09170 [Labrenzia sp. C1B70]